MNRSTLAALVLLAATPTAAGQDEPVTVVFPGACRTLAVDSKAMACTSRASVVYAALPNGRVVFSIPLSDGRLLGFVGEQDEQPRPEEYRLFLSRVRIGTRASSQATDVDGTCTVNQTADASVVHRLTCEAKDAVGNRFALDFRGNGQRVSFPSQRGETR
jgi:hypothetical protein